MNCKDIQTVAKDAQDVAELIILNRLCSSVNRRVIRDAVKEKQSAANNTCHDVEEIEVSTEEFDMVRLRLLNFQCLVSNTYSAENKI